MYLLGIPSYVKLSNVLTFGGCGAFGRATRVSDRLLLVYLQAEAKLLLKRAEDRQKNSALASKTQFTPMQII